MCRSPKGKANAQPGRFIGDTQASGRRCSGRLGHLHGRDIPTGSDRKRTIQADDPGVRSEAELPSAGACRISAKGGSQRSRTRDEHLNLDIVDAEHLQPTIASDRRSPAPDGHPPDED